MIQINYFCDVTLRRDSGTSHEWLGLSVKILWIFVQLVVQQIEVMEFGLKLRISDSQ